MRRLIILSVTVISLLAGASVAPAQEVAGEVLVLRWRCDVMRCRGIDTVRVIARTPAGILIQGQGDRIPGTGGRSSALRYEWFMIQDSTMGVVFTHPSGLKLNPKSGDYNIDADLHALVWIKAIEINALNFSVWGEGPWLVSVTRYLDQFDGSEFDIDGEWSIVPGAHRHRTTIIWIARTLFEDGTLVEADVDALYDAIRVVRPGLRREDLALPDTIPP